MPSPLQPAPAAPLCADTIQVQAQPDAAAAQIARAVVSRPQERAIEVRLDPPSLGHVRVEFEFTGDAVKAVVSAAEPDTLTLLRRGGGALARELLEGGFGDIDIEFAEERDAPPDRGERWRPVALPHAAPRPLPVLAADAPRLAPLGLVDIRL
ncbi:flagellar hook-length control protein FliK [Parvularcula oceani]|uniref:flagellar hook-length control protein FliK n=1 Tax=Parvularcula oceani TaxID=1247963 RepID=UPI0012DD0364|nr:flagellar hook-length control protein FliK [Parvularcula oceani]